MNVPDPKNVVDPIPRRMQAVIKVGHGVREISPGCD